MKTSVLVVLLVAGCFDPKLTDGGFACGPEDSCPKGQSCYASRCYTHAPATPDASAMDAEPEAAPKKRRGELCDPSLGECETLTTCATTGPGGGFCQRPCSASLICAPGTACMPDYGYCF